MKKVLFTTSALVAVAGMASAGVSLGGSARIGLVYQGANKNIATADTLKVEKRFTINIDGSAETEGGLSMGGRIRLRSDEGDTSGGVSSANVWVGTDIWRVTVGNTSGAMVKRQGFFQGSVGLTGLQWANVGFNIGSSRWTLATYSSRGNAGDVVRLDFNAGDFGVSVSADSTGDYLDNGQESSIAVSYNFGDWNVTAGYAKEKPATGVSTDVVALTAGGSVGDFGVGIQYVKKELIGSKVVLNGSYNFGGTTVTAFVANTSEKTVGSAGIGAVGNDNEFGVGFKHSLGGATLAGGVSRNYNRDTMADLGIRWGW